MRSVLVLVALSASLGAQTKVKISQIDGRNQSNGCLYNSANVVGINTSCGGTGSAAAFTVVTFSATPAFVLTSNTGQTFQLTLTGDVTSSTINVSGITGRPPISLQICQNGGGSHSFAWPANVPTHGSVDPTASSCSSQSFVYDGTNWGPLGALTVVGAAPGITIPGSSSGTTKIQATAAASGVLTLPAATDTLMGQATTDILTNKTFDTAGSGNSLKVNGTAITAVSGTGAVCLASGSACAGGGSAIGVNSILAAPYSFGGGFSVDYLDFSGGDTTFGTGASALHSTSVTPSRFIATAAGIYSICVATNTASTAVQAIIRKNHTSSVAAPVGSVGNSFCANFILANADYLELAITGSSMATVSDTASDTYVQFVKLP